MTSKLIPTRVDYMLRNSLYDEGEFDPNGPIPDGTVVVEGVLMKYGFHPQRLESNRADVTDMLRELHPNFREEVGKGWSFSQACADANGTLWTGEHRIMDALFALAIGLKLARWCLPREQWERLPGGMPYVVLTLPPEPTGV